MRELHQEKKVRFVSHTKNVQPFLRSADVFVLPSIQEGLSLSLLEAMGSAKACLATDLPENREIIRFNQNGLVFKVGDENDLAQKLEKLVRSAALRKKLGEQARKDVMKSYSDQIMLKEYLTFYRQIAQSS
jgi:glycosyltransferase involved in cell wall biosynthesis